MQTAKLHHVRQQKTRREAGVELEEFQPSPALAYVFEDIELWTKETGKFLLREGLIFHNVIF